MAPVTIAVIAAAPNNNGIEYTKPSTTKAIVDAASMLRTHEPTLDGGCCCAGFAGDGGKTAASGTTLLGRLTGSGGVTSSLTGGLSSPFTVEEFVMNAALPADPGDVTAGERSDAAPPGGAGC